MPCLCTRGGFVGVVRMNGDEERTICIISSVEEPSLAGVVPVRDMVRILLHTHGHVLLATSSGLVAALEGTPGLEVHAIDRASGGLPARLARYLLSQLRNARIMVSHWNEVDDWLFFVGGDTQTLPAVLAKISGRPAYQLFGAASKRTFRSYGASPLMVAMLSMASRLNCALADRIVVYSKSGIKDYGLEPFAHKTAVRSRHIVDDEQFRPQARIGDRPLEIGYMARLAPEKGILEFVESLPGILEGEPDCGVRIMGTGELEPRVKGMLGEMGLEERVELSGWAPHGEMPRHLNSIRLLIIPSHTEGLPNVMLEAMACGTAVLASDVGAVPEVIRDGETGYLMRGNGPATIAARALEALRDPRLEEVAAAGGDLVRREYRFEVQAEKWRSLFQD